MDPRSRRALEAILEHAARIEAYAGAAGPAWEADDMAVDAIARRLEEIGERAKQLPPDLLLEMPEVDWRAVKGLRDFLAHDYPAMIVEIVASTVDNDLAVLTEAVRRRLAADGQSKG